MHFLQELVQDYLILAHPQADLPQIEHAEEITHGCLLYTSDAADE